MQTQHQAYVRAVKLPMVLGIVPLSWPEAPKTLSQRQRATTIVQLVTMKHCVAVSRIREGTYDSLVRALMVLGMVPLSWLPLRYRYLQAAGKLAFDRGSCHSNTTIADTETGNTATVCTYRNVVTVLIVLGMVPLSWLLFIYTYCSDAKLLKVLGMVPLSWL